MAREVVDPEAMADELLAPYMGKRRDFGIYTERQLLRRTYAHEIRVSDINLVSEMREEASIDAELVELAVRDMEILGRRAKMTPQQRTAWELMIAGLPEESIAMICGITERAVAARLVGARSRVREVLVSEPSYGWMEVLLEEIGRPCKARPYRRNGRKGVQR